MNEHLQVIMWIFGIIGSIVATTVPVVFYVLGLKIKAELSSEVRSMDGRMSSIQLEIVTKMGETHTHNEVMGEKIKHLETRVDHLGKNFDRMSAQMNRVLSALFPRQPLSRVMVPVAAGDPELLREEVGAFPLVED